ncbi:MAG: hypothetical protein HY907_16465 [Deltaproteobacteria bacterium]|nr:hypothetical protein [Deltaproteobacteria bacterium]
MIRCTMTALLLAGALVPTGCDEGDAVLLDDDADTSADTAADSTTDEGGGADADADAGSEAAGGPWDLSFSGVGFSFHNGNRIEAAVIDAGDGTTVARSAATVTAGAFEFAWPGVLAAGHDFRVDYYIDYNRSGSCEPPPADHGWTMVVPAFVDDVSLTVTHSATFYAGVCASFPRTAFDLTLSGIGFGFHDGQTMNAALVDLADGSVVDRLVATVAAGAFELAWPGELQAGRDYRVDYYADYNGNGTCDAPPADHGWTVDVPPFSDDVTLGVTHSTTFFSGVCASF